jgi:8-hydroxy-5-deazaflavin:NADPH oxidoreductase
MKNKIGIIGSGEVAKALGNGFLKYGCEVMLSSRDISKLEEWKQKGGSKARTGSFSDAAKFGELIVLSINGSAAAEALKLAGEENLKNKIIIDTTNPIAPGPPVNGVIQFFTDFNESLMEKLQRQIPDAHFVKSFNSVGSILMVNPDFGGTKPSMFICGNNADAKKEVAEILEKFGFETEDMGTAESARSIEPLAILWCSPGFLRNDWYHAFKLLKK